MLGLIVAGALGLIAWAGQRPIPGLAPARGGPLVVWDRERIVALAGLGLTALVVWRADLAFVAEPGETFGRAGWLWLGGMALLIAATARWPDRAGGARPAAFRARPRLNRAGWAEVVAVAGLLALALALRLWDLRVPLRHSPRRDLDRAAPP